ncbi:hypothetical protein HI914_02194 [Erysiphe necator]|nr:hypothetical protein HI914_02194 [Erysiphe necator]
MSTVAGRLRAGRRTRAKPIISYAESSESENEIDDKYLELEYSPRLKPLTRSRSLFLQSQRRETLLRVKSQEFESYPAPKKRRQISNPELKISTRKTECQTESGVIPAWQNLPYHIFVQIFRFASYPLYDERTFQPLPSGSWLLKIARMCRAFAEPALTVLNYSPPLIPMIKAHRLVDLFKTDPTSLAFKYRQKVVSLQIEVNQVAAYTLTGCGHLDLYSLVRNLPRLLDLEFYHQKDMIPFRDLKAPIKWVYPESVFEALEYIDPAADSQWGDKTKICRLRSWRWSSRLAGKKWPLYRLSEVHMRPSFRSLRKIAFINYQKPSIKNDEKDPNYENILAESLKYLPNIEHLIFESSTLFNSKLLPLLPNNLRHLEVINCLEINSNNFADFLITHGQQLRNLILNYNQSLNLAFLTVLGSSCPHLETLRMNMTFFNIQKRYQCSEPLFDNLLLSQQVPVWPKKLQVIELSHLRKWNLDAAEVFFTSLIDYAAELSDLRRLSIQAIINGGWRDRASFRDKWVGLLNRVFKRNPKPPEPVYSIRSTAVKQSSPEIKKSFSTNETIHEDCSPRKSQIAVEQKELKNTSVRRSQRSATRAVCAGKYAESMNYGLRELNILRETGGIDLSAKSPYSLEPLSEESNALNKKRPDHKVNPVIQGMCDSVEIRIDNLRPIENQITEADFIDEEISGDEDWNSDEDQGESANEDINTS